MLKSLACLMLLWVAPVAHAQIGANITDAIGAAANATGDAIETAVNAVDNATSTESDFGA
jgi:hypothetical protein